MDVEALRQRIPATQRTIYMNTGWSGPSPVSVVEAMTGRLEYESYFGPTSPEVRESDRGIKLRAREAVAGLLHAAPEEVCLTRNTTHGLNLIVTGLPWQPEDEVITFDLEHSAVMVPALNLQRRFGVHTRVLPLAPDEDADSILAKVEAVLTQRTRLIFFSHIQYTSGLRMPLEGIRDLARAYGVWLLVDGAQTAGHIDLDMHALGVDFYSIPGQKWLLGPDGIGALYIRQEAIPLVEPAQVSGSFASRDPLGELDLHSDVITKFNLSTSSTPLAAGLEAAVGFIQEVGVEEIEVRARGLARTLKTRLSDMPGITLHSPLEERTSSGLTTFSIAGVEPEQAVAHLWESRRIVARRVANPSGIRLALDFFNTEEELETVLEAVGGLSEGGP